MFCFAIVLVEGETCYLSGIIVLFNMLIERRSKHCCFLFCCCWCHWSFVCCYSCCFALALVEGVTCYLSGDYGAGSNGGKTWAGSLAQVLLGSTDCRTRGSRDGCRSCDPPTPCYTPPSPLFFVSGLHAPPSSIKKPTMNQYFRMQSRVYRSGRSWEMATRMFVQIFCHTHRSGNWPRVVRRLHPRQGLLDLLTSCWPPPTRKWQRNLHSSSIFHSGKKLESFNGGFFLGFVGFKHHSCLLLLLLFVE